MYRWRLRPRKWVQHKHTYFQAPWSCYDSSTETNCDQVCLVPSHHVCIYVCVCVCGGGGVQMLTFSNYSVYMNLPQYRNCTMFGSVACVYVLALIIYGKDEDFSRRFRDKPNFLVDTDDFLLQRNNDSFEAVFPSGICIVRYIAYL